MSYIETMILNKLNINLFLDSLKMGRIILKGRLGLENRIENIFEKWDGTENGKVVSNPY